MRVRHVAALLAGVLAACAGLGGPAALAGGGDRITECHRLAAHPDDPDRLATGVSQGAVDLPAAIAACRDAVAALPDDPRLNYQLARVLSYAGRGREAFPHRAKAVAGGYPQALFVVGYITLFGLNEQPLDVCKGGELIRRSALAGRFAGQVAFPHYALQGRFDACPQKPDRDEMQGFLEAAAGSAKGDYYREMLVERLQIALRSSP